jgi:glycosyltransferase involved in cell wall biosynthesis
VEAAIIIGIRAAPEEPERRHNLVACLESLQARSQTTEVVVIEQDAAPHLEQLVRPLADRYIFARNAGLYNRGWAFNIGAAAAAEADYLFLLDADVLLPYDSFNRALERMRSGVRVLRPYTEALFLNPENAGDLYVNPMGLCLWIRSDFYRQIGGHDECFRGWGWEDREFWERIERHTPIERMPDRILHQYHPRRVMDDVSGAANAERFHRLLAANFPKPMDNAGDITRYSRGPVWDGIAPAVEPAVGGVRISIVMPTYRREHTIQRAIASILAQTHRHWELTIINNAPGDFCTDFGDPRIHVYQHSDKASASHARNHGLQYATGDLICFFDDDDEMFPGYLARFADAFRDHPTAGMVTCGIIRPDGSPGFTLSTPGCCLRRESATADWIADHGHDKVYFRRIAERNNWTVANGGIVELDEVLCRAWADPSGGLRRGDL